MNYYAEAISILEDSDEVVIRQLLIKIAQQRPGAVVRAYSKIGREKTIDEQLIEYIKSHRKIESIKFCRSLTGEGLLEAKEHVERLML